MYRVFENDKEAIIEDTKISTWKNCTFETKREAEVYACLWAYHCYLEEAERDAQEMELGKKYNMSTCGVPVMMEIREITV